MTIINSTITGNSATVVRRWPWLSGEGTILNSTITGNSALARGGGLAGGRYLAEQHSCAEYLFH